MIHQIEIYFLLFLAYSFLGWLMEVICKMVQYKRFINRGFLIRTVLPDLWLWGDPYNSIIKALCR